MSLKIAENNQKNQNLAIENVLKIVQKLLTNKQQNDSVIDNCALDKQNEISDLQQKIHKLESKLLEVPTLKKPRRKQLSYKYYSIKLLEKTKKIEKLQLKLKTIKTLLQKKCKQFENTTKKQMDQLNVSLLNKLENEKSRADQREQDVKVLLMHLATIEKEYNEKTKMILSSLNLEQNQCDKIESELKSVHQMVDSFSHLNVPVESKGDGESKTATNNLTETFKSTIKALSFIQNEFIGEILRYQAYIKDQNQAMSVKSYTIDNLNKNCETIQLQLDKYIKTVAHKNRVIAKLEKLILNETVKMSEFGLQLQMKIKNLEQIVMTQEQNIESLNVQLTKATTEIQQQIEIISMQKRVLRLRGELILSMQHHKYNNK